MSSSPHDGTTPLLLTPQSGYSVSLTSARSPPSSIGSSPHSSESSSSSVTITHTTLARAERANRDGLLLQPPPRMQGDTQGHTPPPAYVPLGSNSPWGPHDLGPPTTPSQPLLAPQDAPVFDLYSAHTQQFGPTPLGRAATVPFAAYIDAPGAPDARAYRRFVSALAVALLFCAVFGVAAVLEIVGEQGMGMGFGTSI
ncbi:hypothetical protein BDN70DRAFT_994245 [Pholiota conissans]|uniref:Uncharacterized protein n=1 Tax=Pholiota conissans TaxID=109636 RepID=A0A9P6CZK2_9AGAR|nr:hypothetical protein BDN70DRAFT_994245 [Pholiota conissans]